MGIGYERGVATADQRHAGITYLSVEAVCSVCRVPPCSKERSI